MAKIGEGDPRWLVEERQDGRNVGAWHWEEKDITASAKSILKKVFEPTKLINDTELDVSVKKLDKVDGDASINLRKGKTLLVFDLEVSAHWEGEIKSSGKTSKGELEFSFNMEDVDDFEVTVKCDGSAEHDDRLKTAVRTKGVPAVRSRVAQFVKELKESHAQLLQRQTSSPTITPSVPKAAAAPAPTPSPAPAPAPATVPVVAKPPAPVTVSGPARPLVRTKALNLKIEFRAPPPEIYNTLLDAGRVSAFTQSAATISREVGGSFSMFGGSVSGEQVELSPPFKIVQKWRSASWPQGHFSNVKIELKASKEGTEVTLTQTEVPEDDFQRTEQGWRDHFWDRMRVLFGYVNLSS